MVEVVEHFEEVEGEEVVEEVVVVPLMSAYYLNLKEG